MFFCAVLVFYFIKISKFALPGVMLMYERTSIVRKKERKKERINICYPSTNVIFCPFMDEQTAKLKFHSKHTMLWETTLYPQSGADNFLQLYVILCHSQHEMRSVLTRNQ